uniref:Uncharacterized protein n=1 Tax=Microbacterium testaceum TaxID=2033 RepID=C6L863_MICTE|nr:hypothetical protein [Microbacterium testaceum StLB037]
MSEGSGDLRDDAEPREGGRGVAVRAEGRIRLPQEGESGCRDLRGGADVPQQLGQGDGARLCVRVLPVPLEQPWPLLRRHRVPVVRVEAVEKAAKVPRRPSGASGGVRPGVFREEPSRFGDGLTRALSIGDRQIRPEKRGVEAPTVRLRTPEGLVDGDPQHLGHAGEVATVLDPQARRRDHRLDADRGQSRVALSTEPERQRVQSGGDRVGILSEPPSDHLRGESRLRPHPAHARVGRQ